MRFFEGVVGALMLAGLTCVAQAADKAAYPLPPAPNVDQVDLPPAPHIDLDPSDAPRGWAGVYFGVNAGYGFGQDSFALQRETRAASPYGTLSLQPDGFVGGAQAGYNYVFGNGVLVGAEADFDGASIESKIASHLGNFALAGGSHLDYVGTIRARAGYAFGAILVYGTGGFAYGAETSNLQAGTLFVGSASPVHTGYAFGGGVAYALAENVAVKTEFLRTVLDSQQVLAVTSGASRVTLQSTPTANLIRAGIDVHFASWTAPAPVVARY